MVVAEGGLGVEAAAKADSGAWTGEAGDALPPQAGRPPLLSPLVMIRLITCVSACAEGYHIASFGSVAHKVQADLDLEEWAVGLVAALVPAGVVFGAAVAGRLADLFGRKPVLLATYLGLFAGCLCQALASRADVFVAGRSLVGTAVGSGLTTVSVYIAETAPASVRGTFTSAEELFICFGIGWALLAAYLVMDVGYDNDWRWVLGIGAGPPLLAAACLASPRVRESPRYLQAQGRAQEAREAIAAYHCGRGGEELKEALAAWEADCRWADERSEDTDTQSTSEESEQRCSGVVEVVGLKQFPMAALIGAVQLGTGMAVLSGLCSCTLRTIMPVRKAHAVCLAFGSVKLLFLLPSVFLLIDLVGRRPLLLASLGGSAVALVVAAAGVAFRIGPNGYDLFLLGLYAHTACFSLGLGPVTYVYISEVFPSDLRGAGVGLCLGLSRAVSTFWVVSVPMLLSWNCVDLAQVALCWGCISAAVCLAVYRGCPETRSRTLEQIVAEWPSEPGK